MSDGGSVSAEGKVVIKPKVLKELVTCFICKGYFRDPVTVRECLHSFCKHCMVKYIAYNSSNHPGCPNCEVSLGSRPFESYNEDRMLHELLLKVFPEVYERDAKQMAEFYEARGIQPQGKAAPAQVGSARKADADARPTKKRRSGPTVTFKLAPLPADDGSELPKLSRPVISTLADATVRHIKKFLCREFSVPAKDIDVLFNGEPQGSEHTLAFILKTRHGSSDAGRPIFHYRKNRFAA
mmetsp:Transcript_15378/g.60114  ORF Transcript_15378/g.60114 Transcript_15378/m.60114 type:complete len:239 (+) Transcript_15378:131-847(+)